MNDIIPNDHFVQLKRNSSCKWIELTEVQNLKHRDLRVAAFLCLEEFNSKGKKPCFVLNGCFISKWNGMEPQYEWKKQIPEAKASYIIRQDVSTYMPDSSSLVMSNK